MKKRNVLGIALASAALLLTAGCADRFQANVARFQQLPAPQGQTFTIVADDPRLAGGLEFSQYASLLEHKLGGVGYVPSQDPARADLVVRMRYSVDNGREKVQSTGFAPDPFYYGYGRYGYWGYPYHWGFYDPFLFGPNYNQRPELHRLHWHAGAEDRPRQWRPAPVRGQGRVAVAQQQTHLSGAEPDRRHVHQLPRQVR
jgi:hypothetical protein